MMFGIGGKADPGGKYLGETVWNDEPQGFMGAGGGGVSMFFSRPAYQRHLGKPVRACASAADDVACLEGLGFERPCAQIWAYNTTNTRNQCLEVCLDNFASAYNQPDGSLNPCLQCDEDRSGPVFLATCIDSCSSTKNCSPALASANRVPSTMKASARP